MRTAAAPLPWVEEWVERLLRDLRALTVELRAVTAGPPLPGTLPLERERLRAQVDLLRWECARVCGQLGRLRATGRADDEEGAGLVEPTRRPC